MDDKQMAALLARAAEVALEDVSIDIDGEGDWSAEIRLKGVVVRLTPGG